MQGVWQPPSKTNKQKTKVKTKVSLKANLARNASRGVSRVSLDNEPRVEYSYASGTKEIQQSSKCLANFVRQIVEREMSVPRFLRDSLEGLGFFVQFHMSCTVHRVGIQRIRVHSYTPFIHLNSNSMFN